MIKLKNLTKIYQSQSKEDVVANDSISLTFAKKGLIFIIGKSGSGKTTLLNILAGLDEKTSGEYFIGNKSIDEFKSLDDFRNKCVGFVFQDYNLINYLSVSENVEIALSLQGVVDKNKVSSILSEVGLKGYENRRISELSGGQKQRVAIARALVKNSNFILADEPTGNLDSKTSEEIMKLLKQISKNKLIVVVSHNEELAMEYADRVIELADGKVVSDVGKKSVRQTNIDMRDKTNTKPLSFKYIAKMGFYNIKNHLGKSIISVLLFVLTIFSICIGQMFLSFDSENAIVKTLSNKQLGGYLAQSVYQYENKYNPIEFNEYSDINDALYKNVLDNKSHYIKGYNVSINETSSSKYTDGSFYLISTKQDLLNLGIEFYSAIEISDDGVYLTDYAVDYLLKYEDCKFDEGAITYSEMAGKNLLRYDSFQESYQTKYKVCGIVKTDYKDYIDDRYEVKAEFDKKEFNSLEIFNTFVLQKKALEYFPMFVTEKYINENLTLSKIDFAENSFKKLSLEIENNSCILDSLSLINSKNYNYQTIYNGKVVYSNEIELRDGEILINLSLYNKLFNEIAYAKLLSYISFDEQGDRVCKYNFNHLNEKLTFKINQLSLNEDIFEIKDKKIVGIVIKTYDLSKNDGLEIYLSSDIVKNNTILGNVNNVAKFKASNFDNFSDIIFSSRDCYNVGVKAVQSEAIYNIEQTSNMISFIFLGLSVVFVIIAILTTINVIALSINSRKKEIGILRAIGTKKQDIEKMFIFENFITSITTFIVSMISVYLGTIIINSILTQNSISSTIFIMTNIYCWAISFGVSFMLSFVACIIPLKHINKLNPIDAIKNIN